MLFLISYISVTEEGEDHPASDAGEEGEERREEGEGRGEEEVNQDQEDQGEKWGMHAHSFTSNQGLKLWMSIS